MDPSNPGMSLAFPEAACTFVDQTQLMIYKAIGLMSGSSLDGLDMVFVHFQERAGVWAYTIKASACMPYDVDWTDRLRTATQLSAEAYMQLHAAYGAYLGQQVLDFMQREGIELQVDLVGSHGHTTFHQPSLGFTAQLGDGAALAARTGLAVVSDLRALDVAFGGQGAPIVPIGEQLLFAEHQLFVNLGGIANLSVFGQGLPIAYDICPANRVLNELAAERGASYDADGKWASEGRLHDDLFRQLNGLAYYAQEPPKSLANAFGLETVLPLVRAYPASVEDKLRTYVEHIAWQIRHALETVYAWGSQPPGAKVLVTGGGALNTFLVERIAYHLEALGIETEVPDIQTVQYKEALIMAFMAVLRWREQPNVLSSVTGASRSSIGGALWLGQDG